MVSMKKQDSNTQGKRVSGKYMASHKTQTRKPLITALEPRLLLDGAAVATAVEVISDAQLHLDASQTDTQTDSQQDSGESIVVAPTELRAVDPAQNNGRKEVVFIEDNVADYQTLIDSIGAGVEVVLLDSTQDGLAQMALWAQSNSDYDAIHLISHGSEASVNLGALSLDSSAISSRSADLAQLGAALNEDGDLLLYGCDVASGEGQDFITALAQATQADVAASDDITGSADKGGDWVLESKYGNISDVSIFDSVALENFGSTLEIITYAGLGGSDSGGAGFKTVTDNRIVVSNGLSQDGTELYPASSNTEDFIFKADGTNAKTFTFNDMSIRGFVELTLQAGTSVTFKDSSGNEIKSLVLNSDYNLSTSATTISFIFGGGSLASIDNVASIKFSYAGGTQNLQFVSLDLTGFSVSSVPSTPDLDAVSDTGTSSTDNVTNNTTPTFTITGVANGATVTLFNDANNNGVVDTGETLATGTASGTSIQLTTSSALTSGTYNIKAIQTVGGTNSDATSAQSVTIDTAAPTETIASATFSADTTANGGTNSDFITKTAEQTVSGTLSANLSSGESVYVSLDNGVSWSVATASVGSNTWSLAGQTLTESNVLKVKVTDTAGNDGTVYSQSYVLDTTAPTTTIATANFSADTGASGDFITNTANQTVSGTLSANLASGETVYVSLDNGVSWSVATASVGSNTWSLAGQTLTESNVLKVKVTDTAGNDGTVYSQSYVLDTTAPTITSITRQTPTASSTAADSLVYQVTFSDAVSNLEASDFSVAGTTASVTSVSQVGSTNVYNITVSGGDLADLNGTVSLGFSGSQNIQDSAGNVITNTTPTGSNDAKYDVINSLTVTSGENSGDDATFSDYATDLIDGSGLSLAEAMHYASANQTVAFNLASSSTVDMNGQTLNVISGVTFDSDSMSALTISNGTLNLTGSTTFTNGTGDTLNISSVLSGSGALVKAGAGTLTLSGSNSYSGETTVSAGSLSIAGDSNLGSGALTLNGGALFVTGSDVTIDNAISMGSSGGSVSNVNALTLSGNISGTGALAKTGAGTLTLSGSNSYSGETTVSAGSLSIAGDGNLGSGALTLNGGALSVTGSSVTIDNAVSLGSSGGSVSNANAVRLSGAISGTGALIKEGAGTLSLSGINTYTGATTVSAGILTVSGGSAISDTSAVTVASGATFELSTDATETVGSIAGAGNIVANGGTLTVGGDNTSTTFSGVISEGPSGLTLNKVGSGTLTLSGSNSYSGSTTVLGGGLSISGDSNLGTGALTLNSGTLSVTGNGSTIDNAITLINSGVLNLDAGVAATFSGVVSGSGGLLKTGAGTATLSGTNTYSGATVLNGGTLSVSGALNGTSQVTVNSGTTLAGSGSIFVSGSTNTLTVNNGGFLAPGVLGSNNGVGALTVNGHLVLNGTLKADLTGASAGTDYDQVVVAGDVTLGANSAFDIAYSVTSSGNTFTLIDKQGVNAISGTLNGVAEGGTLTSNSHIFQTSYVGGTGNDITLKDNAAPVITSGATGNVDENASTSTVIYTATATDADNDSLTYSLSGTDAALLNINASTGAVTLKNSADYETKNTYSFNIVVTDSSSGHLTGSKAVTVSVNDLNDHTPVMTSGATGSVNENADTSTVIYTATATDADGTATNNTLRYSLSGADAALLDINVVTGVVTLKASADYETKSSYSFNVIATDNGAGNLNSGSLSTTQAVTVSVNDLNDNTPAMTSGATGSVNENADTSTVIYTATATDADGTATNNTLRYSLSGADAALLDINAVTGVVTLKASADYETKSSYSFNVIATDNGAGNLNSGSLSTTQAVTVSVNDLNDNTPVMTSGATGSVNENADTSTVIYTATATDADGTATNNTLRYSLSGADAALLDINAVTGVVTLKASADYETKSSYSFNVIATDNGAGNLNSGSLSTTQAVTVSVNDLNDNTPVMTSGATGSVDENADTSTVIYTATGTDADGTATNNTLRYSLSGDDADKLIIDATTGEVTLKASADYETQTSYSFNVVATDNGAGNFNSGSLSTTQAVIVSVNDLNDNTPVMTSGATGSVDENADTSTVIYTATATDADGTAANSTLVYSLSGDDADKLIIDATTGEVTLKASADYETQTSYSFNVVATDNGAGNFNSGSLSTTQAVIVSVNDLNDNTPVMTSGATGSVNENADTSTVIYTATATDADGTAANSTLVYSLSGDDADKLIIDATTGEVTLKASADYETQTSYSFNVVATDNGAGNFNSGSLSTTQAVIVSVNDLNDNTPVMTSGATGSVNENADTSTVIYTATATDADGTATNNTLRYSLSGDDAALLDINAVTGVVTLKASADYETKSSYSFNVIATDNGAGNLNSGSLSTTQAVIVSVNDLNDNTPVMTSGATGSVDENADTSTVIYTATGTDADGTAANNTLRYSLSGDDADKLIIDATTGEVTLKASADYETKSSYSFNVIATDNGAGNLNSGSLSTTQAVTVSVNDLNDNTPVMTSSATGSVNENADTSTVIYTATATDADGTATNNTLRYSLSGDDAALLDINAVTGVVTLKASADYETKSSYSFNVIATDNGAGNLNSGSLSTTQAVTVSVNDLNDNAPVITSGATASIDENAATSTVVYTATATDADGTSANNTISFSLTGTDAAAFDVDSSTGVVTLKASADYETKSSYSFNVIATDNGAGNLTDTQAVIVSVNDLNDNAPVITSGATASIDENAATSTVVYTATATDADGTSANNAISFSLTGTDAAAFDIDSSTGVVTLKASADYETKASYSFNVVATDNGAGNFNSGSLSTTQAVIVSVNDLNDNTPVMTSGATGSVNENADTSTVIYTATATDADGTAANSTLVYSLSGDDADKLIIDATTGEVTLKASADYETQTSYSFNVVATDNGAGNFNSGSLSTTQAVIVSVNDLNDNTPTVSAGAETAILVEAGGVNNAAAGTNSSSITLTKGDVDTVGSVSYDATYLTNNGWTTLDNGATYSRIGTYGTATLTVSTDLVSYVLNNNDSDTQSLVVGQSVTDSFTIQVTDGNATQSTSAVFNITGANDAPIVSGTVANMSGTSGQIFTPVTLPANLFADVDNGETSKLVWSIENLPTGLVFNAATRTISGTPQGGFEGVNTLQVVATDSNGGQVKVPVTLTLKPSPVTPPVEANPNTTAPLQPLGGGADFNAPDVDPNVESLPSGLIDSGAGVSGFAGETADEVQLVDVAAPIDSAVSIVPSPTAESNGQGASNGVIVSESRVSVDVGANGQVRVTEGVGQLSNSTGLTIASMVTQADRVSISLSDTGVAASYSATLVDGSSLPSWVEVNPTTGEISMTPPSGQGKITLKINAVDASGNIRVLEVEVDLDQLPASVQDESTESATQANSAVFVPLDEQLAIAAEQFDEYGNDLMKLLAS
uniref:Autotransporter-associated beta strand repeat protein n=1 Tax=Marinomonas sp. (strain MWYL1) TaxID=400668 RepID=A6VVW9_MARMS